MSDDKIQEHPSTILRREVEELKRKLEKMERSLNVTEQVMVEMVHKHNAIKDQIIKLTSMISPNESFKKKRNTKPDGSAD